MTSGIKIQKLISDNYRDLLVSLVLGYCTKPSSTTSQRSNQEQHPCTCFCKFHNFPPLRAPFFLMFLPTIHFHLLHTNTFMDYTILDLNWALHWEALEKEKKSEANGGRRNTFRRRVNTINIKLQFLISYNGSINNLNFLLQWHSTGLGRLWVLGSGL